MTKNDRPAVSVVGAGIIEGYVSPDPHVTLGARLTIGIAYWLFMVALLSGHLWPRRADARAGAAAFRTG